MHRAVRKDQDEFERQAVEWCGVHGLEPRGTIKLFDNRIPYARRIRPIVTILREAAKGEPLDCVAAFCHGWRTGLQFGASLRFPGTMEIYTSALADCIRVDAKLPLYACSAGRDEDAALSDDLGSGPGGDGGPADIIRDELSKMGAMQIVVDAHITAGHTTRNPFVRRFPGAKGGAIGGKWIISPDDKLWLRWKMRLRKTFLRHRFPFMTTEEIRAELAGATLNAVTGGIK